MSKGNAEARLVDVTSIPVIYVDDFAKVVVDRGNVRVTFIEQRTLGNERIKMPVLEIVMPLSTCEPDRFARMLAAAMRMDEGKLEIAGSKH